MVLERSRDVSLVLTYQSEVGWVQQNAYYGNLDKSRQPERLQGVPREGPSHFFLFFLCDEAAFGVGSSGELEGLLEAVQS